MIPEISELFNDLNNCTDSLDGWWCINRIQSDFVMISVYIDAIDHPLVHINSHDPDEPFGVIRAEGETIDDAMLEAVTSCHKIINERKAVSA